MTTIFLSDDVMTGRNVDQILPHPSPSWLREPWVRLDRGEDGTLLLR